MQGSDHRRGTVRDSRCNRFDTARPLPIAWQKVAPDPRSPYHVFWGGDGNAVTLQLRELVLDRLRGDGSKVVLACPLLKVLSDLGHPRRQLVLTLPAPGLSVRT
ncbi:hypothetical protein PAPYR_10288 [Paratrimastix pyriformis]|uniref:Uncharacterized protein n=1 Tax=Paratrimastix pyriformis TaxID=342808 RepID=A0ABQ8U6A7_9EUKA|nr:hypothetical protein PAPYR_10288 [Paratrimastix pyriformis]